GWLAPSPTWPARRRSAALTSLRPVPTGASERRSDTRHRWRKYARCMIGSAIPVLDWLGIQQDASSSRILRPRRVKVPIRWLWRAAPVTVLMFLLSGCSLSGEQSMFSPAGPVAQDQLDLFMWTWYLSIPVMLIVGGVMVFVLIRYRRRAGDDSIPGQTHGNVLLEVIWTTVPVIIVILVAVPTVRSIFQFQSFIDA